MEDSTSRIPKTIDNMTKLLFWDIDIAFSFLVGFGIGIALGQITIGSIIGAMVAWIFSKMRSGQARGYARHLLYWYMPINFTLSRTPPSHLREYIG
jgi:conjugal transfer pilus assembly protein TraL